MKPEVPKADWVFSAPPPATAVFQPRPAVVTASDDGACIVWDLTRYVRSNILYAQTYFKSVAYFPDESQILTTGSDRKVAPRRTIGTAFVGCENGKEHGRPRVPLCVPESEGGSVSPRSLPTATLPYCRR